jgi:D-alanyl-D-alanine carboxypeptidase
MGPLRLPALTLLLALVFAPAAARSVATPAHILVDGGSGAVLEEEAAAHRWHPASLTKLMTIFLTLEAVSDGRLGMNDVLPISNRAATISEFKLGLRAGQSIRAREAILAVLQRSANDAAVVLAERIGGSESAFAEQMTAKAAALGMAGTRFRNATGLPDPAQITTARDMAVLARAILDRFPQHADLFAAPGFSYDGQSWPTINGLLTSYPGAEAVKTGFTCDSGYNIVASAKRGGRRVIAVVLGGRSKGERNALAAKLLSAGFAASATPTRSVADLAQAVDEPPHVLPASECVASRGGSGASGGLGGGSDWAMLLGTFASAPQARAAIESAKGRLVSGSRSGSSVVAPRPREGAQGFTAAIGGLSRPQASAACKQLWESDVFCRPLLRSQLANEKARRRT